VSTRSVRRWRARGRAEPDALSLEAQLVLALDRAEKDVRALSWRETAKRLDADFGAWTPLGGDLD
jgi:hypothetical protein